MDLKWIDLLNPTREDLKNLSQNHSLHPFLLQDCMDPEHLPKFEKFGDIYFIILRAYDERCHFECDTVQELTRKIAIFVSQNFIITIHRRPYPAIEDLYKKWSQVSLDTAKAPVILSEIMESVFNSYEKPVDQAMTELEQLEEHTFETPGDKPDLLRHGYFLKRKASVIKRMIRMSMEVTAKIDAAIFARQTPHLQDLKDTLDSVYFFADDLVENINNLLNLHISLSSQKTNEVMRLLTVFSLFFMPLNFIASIYGMNFENMPELKHQYGYPVVLLIMSTVATLIYFWFKRQGWLKNH